MKLAVRVSTVLLSSFWFLTFLVASQSEAFADATLNVNFLDKNGAPFISSGHGQFSCSANGGPFVYTFFESGDSSTTLTLETGYSYSCYPDGPLG